MLPRQRAQPQLYCEDDPDQRNRLVDAAIEQDLYLRFDDPAPRQTFVQGLVARLDWYKTGSAPAPFRHCTDPGAAADVQAAKRMLKPASTSGGDLAFAKAWAGVEDGPAGRTPHPASDAGATPSRKRSLESAVSESDEVHMDDAWTPRRRLE